MVRDGQVRLRSESTENAEKRQASLFNWISASQYRGGLEEVVGGLAPACCAGVRHGRVVIDL
jgi:hypothetical protein